MQGPDFEGFSGPGGKPTLAERELITQSATGEIADVSEFVEAERAVSPKLIAAVATARFRHGDWPGWSLHEMGVMLVGAQVKERLDIQRQRIPAPLMFARCSFAGGIDLDAAIIEGDLWLNLCQVTGDLRLENAQIAGRFSASEAEFGNADGDAIWAPGVKADSWLMNSATVDGVFNFLGANITKQFNAVEARFTNPKGDAIWAQTVVAGSWVMTDAVLEGQFDFYGAQVSGQFYANGAQFINAGGNAIWADSVTIGGWFMDSAVVKGTVLISAAQFHGSISAVAASFERAGGLAMQIHGTRAMSLMLANVRVTGGVELYRSEISGPVNGTGARFENPGEIAIWAQESSVGSWILENAIIIGQFGANAARVDGTFSATGASFEAPNAVAIQVQGIRAQHWNLLGATIKGLCDIFRAEIPGVVNANGARFENPGETAVWAQDAKIGSWHLDNGVVTGIFDMNGAVVEGQLSAISASFTNEHDDAIRAGSLMATSVSLNGARVRGMIDLNRAEITSFVDFNMARFENPNAIALRADAARFAGLFMNETTVRGMLDLNSAEIRFQFRADGADFENSANVAIMAPYANFGGGILIDEADGEDGSPSGRTPRIIGGIELSAAEIHKVFRISNALVTAGRHRAISLRDTIVHGETSFAGSTIVGHIHANRARFGGRLSLRGAAEIVASSVARARDRLPQTMTDAHSTSDDDRQHRFRHHAIVLQEARIDGRLVMPDKLPDGIIDLSRARCDTLEDSSQGWPPPLPHRGRECDERCLPVGENGAMVDVRHLVLDGFEYSNLEFPAGANGARADIAAARSRWLAGQPAEDLTRHFNPQPWRQAATVLREMGYDEAARAISIQRRVRQRLADETPWFHRLVSWTLHKVADYGFNPWKTVAIAGALALFCAFVFQVGLHACGGPGGLANSACAGGPAYTQISSGDLSGANGGTGPYPAFSALVYSLDRLLPIPDLGMETYWRPNTDAVIFMRHPMLTVANHVVLDNAFPVGWILYLVAMLEAFLGAILVAIAVTGFTGLLTRDEK